jgi:hypothetical protein
VDVVDRAGLADPVDPADQIRADLADLLLEHQRPTAAERGRMSAGHLLGDPAVDPAVLAEDPEAADRRRSL